MSYKYQRLAQTMQRVFLSASIHVQLNLNNSTRQPFIHIPDCSSGRWYHGTDAPLFLCILELHIFFGIDVDYFCFFEPSNHNFAFDVSYRRSTIYMVKFALRIKKRTYLIGTSKLNSWKAHIQATPTKSNSNFSRWKTK